jgi:hypothetical protein
LAEKCLAFADSSHGLAANADAPVATIHALIEKHGGVFNDLGLGNTPLHYAAKFENLVCHVMHFVAGICEAERLFTCSSIPDIVPNLHFVAGICEAERLCTCSAIPDIVPNLHFVAGICEAERLFTCSSIPDIVPNLHFVAGICEAERLCTCSAIPDIVPN